jgi:hypothetical protein
MVHNLLRFIRYPPHFTSTPMTFLQLEQQSNNADGRRPQLTTHHDSLPTPTSQQPLSFSCWIDF